MTDSPVTGFFSDVLLFIRTSLQTKLEVLKEASLRMHKHRYISLSLYL